MIENFNIVIQQSNLTVMTRYEEHPKDTQRYQSEAALEEGFIRQLVAQGYERLAIDNEQGLIENLRVQLEKLNGIRLSDAEWKRLFTQEIANENLNIEDKCAVGRNTSVTALAVCKIPGDVDFTFCTLGENLQSL